MDVPLAQHRPDRPQVRISDPGEVAAALPQLLGFRPQESVVLIGLGGASGGRVGLTVRADLPAPRDRAAAAAQLVRSLRTDRPAAALLAVVSEAPDEVDPWAIGHEADGALVPADELDPWAIGHEADGALVPAAELPHRELVHELVVALSAEHVPVRDALLVRRGRWWSYDCPHPCCLPLAGTPLPGGVSALAAAAVTTGQVVAPDRAALAARLDAPPGARAAMVAACVRTAGERVARLRAVGEAALVEESWTALGEALARCRPGTVPPPAPLSDDDVAWVVWALRDTRVRDRALGLALGADAAAAEALWTECTRRAPAPLDAAPATLLAVSVWLRGDGAMAGIALDRALDGDPDHGLARLLARGLAACLIPADLRELIEQAVAADAPR
ncbi:DUF4192 domain-containing protein [Blastococcus saxobsidens]|uniref:Uncharacterized protein DUF4192 n=1 Tax=Blastococcus saxobsidens TaxID=138336 RepID=A0A4Q7Y5X7_9ACTN|nr:DUF4192 domain-containing protein [Blastococcus saxobsidens]RZU32342.1 uncharacterized protein DUF4192 [Blastococcus saxobsidens]